MRRSHLAAATSSAVLLLTAAFAGTTVSVADASSTTSGNGRDTSYVVVASTGTSADTLARRLTAAGETVTSVNSDIGTITVSSKDAGFRGRASGLDGVVGVATDRVIGYQPDQKPNAVENEALAAARAGTLSKAAPKKPKPVAGDPLDSQLWGMQMIGADRAHAIDQGSKKVKVGIIDTGVDAHNPDLRPNFDFGLSRNFVTDIPEIDGPCEVASCVDPVGEDDDGHGTHVAGTIAAGLNGFGVSGIIPKADLVEVRAGQDSGYFFLQPTIDALTYSGNAGIDVVNMSFYVDPWLYNCQANPADSPEAQAEQQTIIVAMNRALEFAHRKGVTLVSATGNNHEDLAHPRTDISSPDYPGGTEYPRPIDNGTCVDLPVEGPNVIGVNAIGPTGAKADYSNYTTAPSSGEVEVSAPGGYFRDGFGTPSYRTNGNLILSTYPKHVGQEAGAIDADGNVTPAGVAAGVQKSCPAKPVSGADACGYYQFLQGTSMASPHAAGVAALIVAAHGKTSHGEFGLSPDVVRSRLLDGATDHACPVPATVSYANEGRPAEFDATCVGSTSLNGFYGHGIVNALAAVQ
ncbi:S8 family serine peptidase [Marmoricola sp. RAF53]|uniref:S8 family serine peptidase n=1 Tax=Marmoricola sp. RAF53 TaxID=3233059 RepID=UPI003F94E94E